MMKRVSRFALLLLLLVVATATATAARTGEPEPRIWLPLLPRAKPGNWSFEGPQWAEAVWWVYPDSTPRRGTWNEVRPPAGWQAWWVEGLECQRSPGYVTGRPEVGIETSRVLHGSKALKWFTFYRCHFGGISQERTLGPGTHEWSLYLEAWHTSCSSELYGPPRNEECDPISSHALVRLGWSTDGYCIDSWDTALNDDPWLVLLEPEDMYGPWTVGPYSGYKRVVSSRLTLEKTTTVRLCTQWIVQSALRHNDWYADKAGCLEPRLDVKWKPSPY
jgi:hypothetical protein